MAHIGIGITTTPNRKEHLKLCLRQMELLLPDKARIFINNDFGSDGVASSKNRCLKALADCDHIFLFDDDCFPIAQGWEKLFVLSGENHLLYLNNSLHKKIGEHGAIWEYRECGGCLIYITKQTLETVGGFCKEYDVYGYEHAGYSRRIFAAGLTARPYQSPAGADQYVYCLDFDNSRSYNINHKPSLAIDQVVRSIEVNKKVFKKDIQTIFQQL